MEPIYLAALIALFVSALFGIAGHIQHIGLDHVDARSGAIINIGTTATILWLASPLYLQPSSLVTHSALLFAIAGLVVPALSLTLATMSVRAIGPSLTSGLSSTSPVFAMMLAVVLVGELLTTQILIGTLTVVGGVMLIAIRSKNVEINWPLWLLYLPFGAAIARAIAHPVIKLGLNDLPSPLTAGLISTTVSMLVLFGLMKLQGRSMPAINRGYAWFVLCGLVNGTGLVLLNVALEIGQVLVVSPIIAAQPAFALLFGYFYFKREVFTLRMVIAIALIFGGCVLIVLR